MTVAPNLIDLLHASRPELLSSLRAAHPAEADVFSSERVLGEVDAGSAVALEPARRKAMLDLIGASSTAIAGEVDTLQTSIRTMLKRVGAIRFGGSLVASISGGLAGILTIAVSNAVIQAITAFLAMLGGIASITADQFERAPSGIRIATAEEYGKIIEMRAALEVIRLQLERDEVFRIEDKEMGAMVAQLDGYAASLIRLKAA